MSAESPKSNNVRSLKTLLGAKPIIGASAATLGLRKQETTITLDKQESLNLFGNSSSMGQLPKDYTPLFGKQSYSGSSLKKEESRPLKRSGAAFKTKSKTGVVKATRRATKRQADESIESESDKAVAYPEVEDSPLEEKLDEQPRFFFGIEKISKQT